MALTRIELFEIAKLYGSDREGLKVALADRIRDEEIPRHHGDKTPEELANLLIQEIEETFLEE